MCICYNCGEKMYRIYGEGDSEGYACLCGHYFWDDKPKCSQLKLDPDLLDMFKSKEG